VATTTTNAGARAALERDQATQLYIDADASFDARDDADATLLMNPATATIAAVRKVGRGCPFDLTRECNSCKLKRPQQGRQCLLLLQGRTQ
jgi:hypothetical protein